MSRRAGLSYRDALRILAGDDVRIGQLETALGAGLLASAPFTQGATLALFDAQGPVMRLIRQVTDTPAGRIKAAKGKSYYELLEASHTVLALSAFFDAFRSVAGPAFELLELTEAEKFSVANRAGRYQPTLPEELSTGAFPMPSGLKSLAEARREIEHAYGELFSATVEFCDGLAAWPRVVGQLELTTLGSRVVGHAMRLYEDRFDALAADLPEFAFRTLRQQLEHNRADVRESVGSRLDALLDLNRKLVALADQRQEAVADPVRDVLDRLTARRNAELRRPLWQAQENLVFPTVVEGFISPGFRWAEYSADARVTEEQWWQGQTRGADIADFLRRYLTDPESPHRPLLILGLPGAGKTMLTKVIAARLPPESFTTIVVPLRHVDADSAPHKQIETALEDQVSERLSWGDLRRGARTIKVVIFDGFDELVQRSGVVQNAYIKRVAEFQEDEWTGGHPVIPVITSRTLVLDRTELPAGSVLVRLEGLTGNQVEDWVWAVNRANAGREEFRRLSATDLLRHEELASQPLLLTLLAIYHAQHRRESPDAEISRAALFGRLLDSFIERQVGKGGPGVPVAERARQAVRMRRDLAVSAFAMVNRNQQVVSGEALKADLECFVPAARGAAAPTGFREPLTLDEQVASAFFFVHQAGDARADSRRTYEFLHASLGDFLIAEHVVGSLRELAALRERLYGDDGYGAQLGTGPLRALLSHEPLVKREAIVEFATELIAADPGTRQALAGTAIDLLARAREPGSLAGIDRYAPRAYDPVRLLAAYTANLVTVAALAADGGLLFTDLMDAAAWTSTVRLWRAGLDEEGQLALLSRLHRGGDGRVTAGRGVRGRSPFRRDRIAMEEARLLGDLTTYARLRAGGAAWMDYTPLSIGSGKLHAEVVELAIRRWPVPSLSRLTLYDERRYAELLATAREHPDRMSTASAALLLACLTEDGYLLPEDLVCGLVRLSLQGVPDAPTAPPELILSCPYLIDEFPQLVAAIGAAEEHAALHALILRRGLHRVPAQYRPTVQRIVAGLERRLGELPLEGGVVSAEMVEQFAGVGVGNRAARWLLAALSEFGELAWQQIPPQLLVELLAHRQPDEFVDETQLASLIGEYLRAHGRRLRDPSPAGSRAALHTFALEYDDGAA